jgi:hypothetical protein
MLVAQFLAPAPVVQGQHLLNVDFGAGAATSKVGFAATGQATNDFWNFYSRDSGTGFLADLKYADGSTCPGSLTVSNAPGAWGAGSSDPMMDSYLYPGLMGSMSVVVSNLPSGLYSLYFYAHGQPGGENGVVHLSAGGRDYGTNSTTTDASWNTPDWQEGRQYVRFNGVRLSDGESLNIRVDPGSTGLAVMNGLQLVQTADCAAVPRGLVGWWPGEGNADDLCGNHPGGLSNGVAFAAGKVGQAFSLDGVDDEILVPASSGLNVASFTVEAWIRPTDITARRPVVEWCAAGDYAGPHLWISVTPQGSGSAPGTLFANIRDVNNGDHLICSAAGLVPSDQWSHVALTYDATTGGSQILLNGAAVVSADLGKFTPKTAVPLHIGRRPADSPDGGSVVSPFLGQIDEVSLYERALSAAEIQAIYVAGASGKCPEVCVSRPAGLVSWWPGNGSAANLVGTNAGTVLGETVFDAAKVGSGFRFDGFNDAVLIPYTPELDLTRFTVEAWVKPASPVADLDNQELIFGQAIGKPQLVVRPGTNGLKVAFMFSESMASFPVVVSTNEIPLHQFSHLAGSWDGTNLSLYINGVLEASVISTAIPAASSCPFYIGGFQSACGYTGQFFNGWVDEVSLYNRALSPAEIQALAAAGSAGKCPPEAAAISVAPASQSVILGGDVTFQVIATGAAPLAYQWLFGTNTLADATNSVLTLTHLQADAAGDYSVTVSNSFGSVSSLPAHLTILFPPVITTQPHGQTVLMGDPATFSVVAQGTEPLNYLWRRNGVALSGANGPILVIGSAQSANAGTYTVRVGNAAGSVLSDPAVLKLASGQIALRMTADGPRLDVIGLAGASYTIEYSPDARQWSTLATFLSMPATWFFIDPTAANANPRFYRLKKTP